MLEENIFRTEADDPGSKMDTKDHSFKDFLESGWRQELISHEEAGTWPKQCRGCLDIETTGLKSYRLEVINDKHRHLHVQTGNICDSDCVMCGPQWSTKVMSRLKMKPDPEKQYLGKTNVPVRSIWNEPASIENLREAAKWTDHIHFGGGEPLIDKRIWDFIETIARSDLSISFVTNLNTLPSARGFELLKSFKNVGMNVSIDATGRLYEWIRHGLSYKRVMTNLATIKTMGIGAAINCEVQAHNVANIPAHHSVFSGLGFLPDYYFVDRPKLLQASNAPKHVIERAIELLPKNVNEQLLLGLRYSLKKHDPQMSVRLMKHTEYLNFHRKDLRFDCDAWEVFLGA